MVEQIWTESVMDGEVEHQQSMLQIINGALWPGIQTCYQMLQFESVMHQA